MRLNTRAFAIATAATASGGVFSLTLFFLAGPSDPGVLAPLGSVLFGYSVSVAGAFVGAMWAYAYGFLIGGLTAFAYNLALVPPPPLPLPPESPE